MPIESSLPLSLYIHIPWCVRKCPYCDFNSHTAGDSLQEELYVAALIRNLDYHLPLIQGRPMTSIFFGGGTPSLFSGKAIDAILLAVQQRLSLVTDAEITLEANPGTVDYVRFQDFYAAGVNRLSLGVQSFQDEKLKTLGRIHQSDHAKKAISFAKQAGFSRFNIDLMYGLPDQSLSNSLEDLKTALSFEPSHLSWYQLTIEPNTLFHRYPPPLPQDDLIWEMQLAGQTLLQEAGLSQYEVSAYAKEHQACRHNMNYWQFGDYLGIGAGAHSKITHQNEVRRFVQPKNPRDYLAMFSKPTTPSLVLEEHVISEKDLPFEFMLNALRLTKPTPIRLFTERTGLKWSSIESVIAQACQKNLLIIDETTFQPSPFGKKFLNDLMTLFLI